MQANRTTCKNKYIPDDECIRKNKKIVADAISHLLNGNICFPFQITALFIKDNYLIWCVSTNKFGF